MTKLDLDSNFKYLTILKLKPMHDLVNVRICRNLFAKILVFLYFGKNKNNNFIKIKNMCFLVKITNINICVYIYI